MSKCVERHQQLGRRGISIWKSRRHDDCRCQGGVLHEQVAARTPARAVPF
jgi:hypothetical protein